jgi:prepilin-type N-terminal cleavage/methylation domain-containing protein
MKRQAGMTLMEIMIALAIMSVMLVLAWKTISNTSEGRRSFEEYEERNQELRVAMGRMVADFEASYLSLDEGCPPGSTCPPYVTDHPRTIFQARASGKVPKIRFSTLGHRVLWADANESEQTVIEYLARNNPDPDHASEVDLLRREQRRPSNLPPDQEPSDYDVLAHDIQSLKLEFWNWRTLEWVEMWDTTQSDGNRGWLPSRVRITLVVKGLDGKEIKLVTQARVYMQEPLNFSPT